MVRKIIIERLEFQGHCGVTLEERQRSQLLAIDLTLTCQSDLAVTADDIYHTVDYAHVADRIIEMATTQNSVLLETFAEQLLTMLFSIFSIDYAKIWIRKLAPPLRHTASSVGVHLERSRSTQMTQDREHGPSGLLTQELHRVPKGNALDVAAGGGRNALYLASQGFQVDALDRDQQAMAQLKAMAQQRHFQNLNVRTVDLERPTEKRPEFPKHTYDLIVVCFYLYRALFPALIQSLKPNGFLFYETFTIDNHLQQGHPRRTEFCLAYNELLHLTAPLRVLTYHEGRHDGKTDHDSVFTAQLVAQYVV